MAKDDGVKRALNTHHYVESEEVDKEWDILRDSLSKAHTAKDIDEAIAASRRRIEDAVLVQFWKEEEGWVHLTESEYADCRAALGRSK